MLLVPGDMFGLKKGIRFGFGFDIEHTMKGLSLVDEVLDEMAARRLTGATACEWAPLEHPALPRLPRRGVGRAVARRHAACSRCSRSKARRPVCRWSTILNKREGYRRHSRVRPGEGRAVHTGEDRAPAGRSRRSCGTG